MRQKLKVEELITLLKFKDLSSATLKFLEINLTLKIFCYVALSYQSPTALVHKPPNDLSTDQVSLAFIHPFHRKSLMNSSKLLQTKMGALNKER